MVRHPPQRTRAILSALGCWRGLVPAQLAVDRPAQVVAAEVTDQAYRIDEPPLARGHHFRVLARDVGLGGEELVAGHREPVLLQQAAGHGDFDLPRVEQGDLEAVVAAGTGALHRAAGVCLTPASDPDQGVDP